MNKYLKKVGLIGLMMVWAIQEYADMAYRIDNHNTYFVFLLQ